ncbi:MAG: glycosyltransferase family 2 protein [Alphaproteobacteria bacterium]|nr:glycosyltransferase family 2 protein [Alphaproteobacteria bacterium]
MTVDPIAFSVSAFFATAAGLLGVPIAVLFTEILAATLLSHRKRSPGSRNCPRPTIAVLVPAHDEEAGIAHTLADIRTELDTGDTLLVVADNCSDSTAIVARAAGAQVAERQDRTRRGKGYALDFGMRCLSAAPPEVVIIVDADCRLAPGALDELARTAAATNRPVQALNLMTAPAPAAANLKAAQFAWRVKNWVRPLGLGALNLPCQLMGTGMAFTWPVLKSAALASGDIVEDLKLGLDLALAGHPPLFCPSAVVTSEFPPSVEAARRQRERWEHGHLLTSLVMAPRLIAAALRRGNLALLALALDLAVPPLALLGLMIVATLVVAGLLAAMGNFAALWAGLTDLAVFVLTVVVAWTRFGRDVVPARTLASVAGFVWAKLPIYGRLLLRGPAAQWIRTDRK